jgi:hypothetical protein
MTDVEHMRNVLSALLAAAAGIFPEVIEMDETVMQVTYANGQAEELTVTEIMQRAADVLGIDIQHDAT